MPVSICGADCAQCPSQAGCGGCAETGGRPFGRACLLAACCPMPGGQAAKMLEDGKVYLGNQLEAGGDRCYGLAADQDILLVCTYGEGGSDPELILYKKRGY